MSTRTHLILVLMLLGGCAGSSSGPDAGGDAQGPADAKPADASDTPGAADAPSGPDGADPPDAAAPGDASDGAGGGSPEDATVDASPDAALDAGPTDAAGDAGDAMDAGAAGDATPPVCVIPPATPPVASGPLPPPAQPARGIDSFERPAWETLRDAALADPEIAFCATWDSDEQAFVVESESVNNRKTLMFRRLAGTGSAEIEVLSGSVEDVFPKTSGGVWGTYDALLAAFEDPNGADLSSHGYAPGDPRVGFLPAAEQSWPLALERLAALFDAPDAPDGICGLQPWASGGAGTHGGLGLLQSRATLALSGRGVRSGVIIDDVATLPDVVPTVLAALGAGTTSGVGPDGTYDDGLYLKRQDGRVLWEALTEEPCDAPRHVLLVLFDGLLATELNHLTLAATPEVDLPVLRALAQGGVVYRYGAVTNFPSLSAPGHMTAGTGLWSGHHGIVSNAFFRRDGQEVLNPFTLLEDPAAVIRNPSVALELYDKAVADGVETLAQAAHRALGEFDPETGAGAFVAVFNEISFGGADIDTLDVVTGAGPNASIGSYTLADDIALAQAQSVLLDPALPVPTVMQLSFVSSDAAGEQDGPHSDSLRAVMKQMDGRMGAILELYEAKGALDDTMVVLVSDHGMELQDPTRKATLSKRVAASGVKVVQPTQGLFYLRTLELEAVAIEGGSVIVTVDNHDDGLPVQGATVGCEGCDPAVTDADGQATLAAPAGATLVVEHPSFNAQTLATP